MKVISVQVQDEWMTVHFNVISAHLLVRFLTQSVPTDLVHSGIIDNGVTYCSSPFLSSPSACMCHLVNFSQGDLGF